MKAQLLADITLQLFEVDNTTHYASPIKDNPSYYATTSGYIVSTKSGSPALLVGRCTNGYLKVLLQGKEHRVHRLVASTFFESPDEDRFETARKQVNHIDGNRKNNKVSNLEWCSSKENHEHLHQVLRAADAREAANV
jgi:hypothetical protein